MRFRLTPRDDRFFPMFAEAAQNLVSATDLLAEFLHVSSNRESWPGSCASTSTPATRSPTG